jgi:hypothetical protein
VNQEFKANLSYNRVPGQGDHYLKKKKKREREKRRGERERKQKETQYLSYKQI